MKNKCIKSKKIVKSKRNSAIEILRLFSMFLIVIHHYAVHGTYPLAVNSGGEIGSVDHAFLFLHFIGRVGVVLFVLIGAYFLCEKRFNFTRPVRLIGETYFYSWLIFLVIMHFMSGLINDVYGKDVWNQVLYPFLIPSPYWFVTSYLVMLLMMPVLNRVINSLTLKQLGLLNVLLFVLLSIIPCLNIIMPRKEFDPTQVGFSTGAVFLFLYLVAAFIRQLEVYQIKHQNIMLVSLIILCMGGVIAIILNTNSKSQFNNINQIIELYNPICIVVSVALFTVIKSFRFQISFVNFIAESTFAIYLITDNPLLRKLIWFQWFPSGTTFGDAKQFLLLGVKGTLVVFGFSILIDILFRIVGVKSLVNRFSNYISVILTNFYVKYQNNKSQK